VHALASLIPVAATAVGTVANQVQDVLRQESPFSRVLRALPSPLVGTDPPQAATVHGEMTATGEACRARWEVVRHQVKTAAAALHARLTLRFAEQGIDLSQPIVLRIDAHGRVLEAGGHWDRADIEQLFEADPELHLAVTELLRRAESLEQTDAAPADSRPGFPTWVIDGPEHSLQAI
jgi:hypothetical protein